MDNRCNIIICLDYNDECPYDGMELLEVTIPDGMSNDEIAAKAEAAIEQAKETCRVKLDDEFNGDSGTLLFNEIHRELKRAGLQFVIQSFYDFCIDCSDY